MQRFLKFSLLLILPLFLNSCFEVREEVNVGDDGAGDFNLVINLSQSKDQVKKYLQAEETNGVMKDKNVESIFKHVKVVMEGVKGMSNVAINSDYEDYIFSVKGDFTNIEVLNTAITTVSKSLDYLYVEPIENKSFASSGSTFSRLFDYPIDTKEFANLPGFAQFALESAKVTSIYRFSKPIKKFSNSNAMVAPSNKAIKLETSVAALGRGTGTMANKIEF
jgi:hypothetical protein